MSGFVPKPALPNAARNYSNSGVEPVDIPAQRWAEYKDLPPKAEASPTQWAVCSPRAVTSLTA